MQRLVQCIVLTVLVTQPASAQSQAVPPPHEPSAAVTAPQAISPPEPANLPQSPPGPQSASVDHDVPTAAGPAAPPFYRPTAIELNMAPPEPGLPWMVGLLEDTHGFVSGSIRGFGSETRLRLGRNHGVTVGTYNFNTFELGYDAFRYSGIHVYTQPRGARLSVFVLVPNLDTRIFFSGSRFAVAFGTSVTGVRVANCALTGCVEASLRLVTLDVWGAGDGNGVGLAVSVGAGLSAGIKL